MAILLNNDGHWHDKWLASLARHLPGLPVHEYPNIPDKDAVEYALIWKHPDGDLENYPNLKAVFSLGSGVDYLDKFRTLPKAPIFRLIDPAMADDMALYTLYWVIHFQRLLGVYSQQQKESHWQRYPTPLAPDCKVCVMGQGAIGGHIAKRLSQNGFNVSGWSRTPKSIEGVKSVHGHTGLDEILPHADILICCLPATSQTESMLDKALLMKLKKGAALINVSRGAVINEPDLLNVLEGEHLSGAALDVFVTEPLPKASPFWSHSKVHVTPHMSGATNPDTAVQLIAANIEKFERGEMPAFRYVREGGE